MRFLPGRRVAAAAAAATLMTGGLSACGGDGSGDEDGLKQVTFNLAYQPQGSVGGIFAAMDQGYYADAGLEVEAVPGYGGARTVNEVALGQWDFGYGDPISVALNRGEGGGARMVGALNTRWPSGLCYDAGQHDIDSIEDLEGLTVGAGTTSPSQQVIPAWLELNGFPPDHFELLKMDFGVIDSSFMSGKIDVDDCWQASNRANVQALAEEQGMDVKWLNLSDFGLDLYGNGIVSSEELIESDPDTVKAFLAATYKGYEHMLEHPEETTAYMTETYPELNPDILGTQVSEMEGLLIDPTTKDQPLGWINPERMESSMQLIHDRFDVPASIEAADIYTNDYLG